MATIGDQVEDKATEKAKRGTRPPNSTRAAKTKKTQVAAVPTPAPNGVGKYKGLGTCTKIGIPAGLRRMTFQDQLLAANHRPDMRKTDEELAAMMDAEHPGGVKIRPDHMRAIRRLYNEGKHTKAGKVPETLSVPYGPDKKPLVVLVKSRTASAA
jgi:hypothetical protein